MQLLVVGFCCLTGLCLIPQALDWRSPVLSSVRAAAFVVLTALPLCLAVVHGWVLKHSRPGQKAVRYLAVLGFLASATTFTATVLLECNFHRIRREVLRAEPERLEKLGRHLLVGYSDRAEARELLKLRGIAGIFITSRNVRGKSTADIRKEIGSFRMCACNRAYLRSGWPRTRKAGLSPECRPPLFAGRLFQIW